ncbi:MAG: nitrile hydratase accessory protein [Mycolicibacterium hassiacum]|jgi:nitrile hydratase accessory protein|uniref:nitrile hydratase accessory protein n=1 Tax=Mycolicibacterium hassiacum TaxID=46351 RepID=UPI0023F9E687|nr:nitrile hydratase accessory protein [Mycolicibacterium hassiacum]MBX5488648.1 nitrile hydratase accessory protein [Mycolicibacterium hassiacum]
MKLHETCTTDQAAPQFEHEWQRRAFGLAVALSEFRHYDWSEFQQALIDTIAEWERLPEDERGEWQYYDHWVSALEQVVDRHQLLTRPVETDDHDHAVAHDH